jgi:hypothetical protein
MDLTLLNIKPAKKEILNIKPAKKEISSYQYPG